MLPKPYNIREIYYSKRVRTQTTFLFFLIILPSEIYIQGSVTILHIKNYDLLWWVKLKFIYFLVKCDKLHYAFGRETCKSSWNQERRWQAPGPELTGSPPGYTALSCCGGINKKCSTGDSVWVEYAGSIVMLKHPYLSSLKNNKTFSHSVREKALDFQTKKKKKKEKKKSRRERGS